jgi:hypothetical protein
MNSPNGTLFLMAWNRPWHGMTTAKSPLFLNFFIVNSAVRASLKCESRY